MRPMRTHNTQRDYWRPMGTHETQETTGDSGDQWVRIRLRETTGD